MTCRKETSVQKGHRRHVGRTCKASFVVGEPLEQDGMRVFAGLVSDPFFMDVEATLRTDFSGKLSFDTACKHGSVSRRLVDRRRGSVCSDRPTLRWHNTGRGHRGEHRHPPRQADSDRASRTAGDQELRPGKPDSRSTTKGVELRDLYNREDAFALSKEYRPLYESRLDANLAFFDGLDGETAWPLGPDGRHPLRDLLMGDFLILDLAHHSRPETFSRSNAR